MAEVLGAGGVAEAARRLRAGEPVAIPTETVYGLAAVAFDAAAVARVFAVKERPTFDPLIVHLAEPQLDDVVDGARLSPAAWSAAQALMAAFWPGPLTLVLPRGPRVPDLVVSGLDTVAVRMPRHPLALAVIRAVGAPLAAPSANRFGRISPTSAADVVAELGDRIGLVLDGGRCEVGVESTVVAVEENGELGLLRPGGVTAEAIQRATGRAPRPPMTMTMTTTGRISAPGMLASHYAPRKPLYLDEAELPAARGPVGLLAFSGDAHDAAAALEARIGRPVVARVLSPTGDLEEAARELFAALRWLDASAAELLLAEAVPGHGLGHAISDRLARAAARE